MTNNPRKIDGLRALGVDVADRIPLVIPANAYDRAYLETKAHKSGHLIDDRDLEQAEPLDLVEDHSAGEVSLAADPTIATESDVA